MRNKKKSKFPADFKGFKFKIYWIYIIIFIFFIGLNFMGTEVTKPTNWQEFNQKMLQEQKVEKVVIVNKEKAYVYIKKNYLSEQEFKDVSKEHLAIQLIQVLIFILKLVLLKPLQTI